LPQCITSNKSALPTPLKKLGGESTSPATLSSLPALPKLPKPVAFSELSMADRGKFSTLVSGMAKEFKLDPRLVLAVMRAESNFDPLARSPKGAQGLMQLIPDTAERFGVKDSNDPGENIRGGMTYLKWLLSLFKGNVVLSLAAYNAGEKTIEKFNGVPPYPETMAYVQRIRSIYPADFHAFDERAAAYRTDKKKR
jgi:soluble lytic murein transglycosylase-like protein